MAQSRQEKENVCNVFWDIAILGDGYPALAAAIAAVKAGKKALLIGGGCSLPWESALARCPVVGKMPPEMQDFMHCMEMATGIAEDWIDPGAAEWVAERMLREAGVARLSFAMPVAANVTTAGLQTVTFAVKSGLTAISAAHWVDATEYGTLARVCGVSFKRPVPIKRIYRLFFQRNRWALKFPIELFTGLYGVHGQMEDSCWPSEKILSIEIGNAFKGPSTGIFEKFLLAMQKRIASKCGDALLSHWSWMPYSLYPRCVDNIVPPCANLAFAVPILSNSSIETLGDRCQLGTTAVARVLNSRKPAKKPTAEPKVAMPVAVGEIDADVCVVGVGTGGLMAATAAARAGAKTLAIESACNIGGMATIGGVRSYHNGCQGGLQDELDEAVKKLMPVFGVKKPRGAYQGLARLVASQTLLQKSQARLMLKTAVLPGTAELREGRIASVLAASPDGIVRIKAKSWIDATDGTALAASVCESRKLPEPRPGWTQTAEYLHFDTTGNLVVSGIAIDGGDIDANDSELLSKARFDALERIIDEAGLKISNSFNRLIGISPLLGVRTRIAVETRETITLDDLVSGRKCDNAIGFTLGIIGTLPNASGNGDGELACCRDTCGLAETPLFCEIPYGAILTKRIDNLWLAGRAAGASPEAAFAFRMMRDVQRIGEVAGVAAAMAVKQGCASAEVPMQRLKAALLLSGALKSWHPKADPFADGEIAAASTSLPANPTPSNIKKWISALGGKDGGIALWHLYRLGVEGLPPEIFKLATAKTAKGLAAKALLKALGASR